MLREELIALLEQVNRELGAAAQLAAPATGVAGLPAPLQALYAETNGLVLPFVTIYPIAQTRALLAVQTFGSDWIEFGRDEYFSVCLCRRAPLAGLSLTLEDHETGSAFEPVYASVVDLLRSAYASFVENPYARATLTITAVPPNRPLAAVIGQLKRVVPASSADLLRHLRSLPTTFDHVESELGIDVVRQLQRQGVSCHLSSIRPGRV